MALPTENFTFRFPLKVASDGGLDTDTTTASQLRLLFATYPGQRMDDLEYGNPGKRFEQSSLDLDAQQLLIVLSFQRAFAQYIPDLLLHGMSVLRDVAARRLILDVLYASKQTYQNSQRMLLDLGVPNG